MCEGESWTFVGTTDFSLPVKNNTDSMNWAASQVYVPTRVEVHVTGDFRHV